MSEENVEIVRRGYDAWNRGDLDAARYQAVVCETPAGFRPFLPPLSLVCAASALKKTRILGLHCRNRLGDSRRSRGNGSEGRSRCASA